MLTRTVFLIVLCYVLFLSFGNTMGLLKYGRSSRPRGYSFQPRPSPVFLEPRTASRPVPRGSTACTVAVCSVSVCTRWNRMILFCTQAGIRSKNTVLLTSSLGKANSFLNEDIYVYPLIFIVQTQTLSPSMASSNTRLVSYYVLSEIRSHSV